MDAQATIHRIIDCINDDDSDGFNEAFEDLYHWLNRGGFAPVVTPKTFGKSIVICRQNNRTFHIQTVMTSGGILTSRFEFSVYDSRGDCVERFLLRDNSGK